MVNPAPGTSIVALVIVRDEWPLVELCIERALEVVDAVIVADHDSADDTWRGLERIAARHADRVELLEIGPLGFEEVAIRTSMLEHARARGFEWALFVDADEFPVLGEHEVLADLLEERGDHVDAFEFEVVNFIANRDEVQLDVLSVAAITARATVTEAAGDARAIEVIEAGQRTFFDYPFGHKMIVRLDAVDAVRPGSHELSHGLQVPVGTLSEEEFFLAHVPMASKDRVELRATRASVQPSNGDPNIGWQSRLVAKAHREGWLDRLWSQHSISGDDGPLHVVDGSLAGALKSAVDKCTGEVTAEATFRDLARDRFEQSTVSALERVIGGLEQARTRAQSLQGALELSHQHGVDQRERAERAEEEVVKLRSATPHSGPVQKIARRIRSLLRSR